MGCCNEPVSALSGAAADPSQHVNYTKGMVLGVDDFKQEFAYLSGRDRWLARDAVGYGTLSGLRVFAEDAGAEGLRLHVSAGSALVPGGRHVCVPADQCATINRWLAKPENAATVYRLLNPASPPLLSPPLSPPLTSPPAVDSGTVSLYLTLCYADCTTRPVPIPGEPCRSDDELMADSRVADDFRLELRERAPAQVEEDALCDFVRWLRAGVQVVDTSPAPGGDDASWLAALRPAAQPWFDALSLSPPASPPPNFAALGDYLFDPSPGSVVVARDRLCDFLRVAFRFWVTELRPLWMAMRCHRPEHADLDCVLLARVGFEVTWVGGSPTGVWQLAGSPPAVEIDETARPFVAHLRLLQEWMLCGCDCAAGASAALPAVLPAAGGGTGTTTAPADGEILIGSGGAYVPAALAGTVDQVTVTPGPGSITLGTAQDLAPASRPQFAGLTTTGAVHVAVASTAVDLTLDDTHHVVLCSGGQSITLPKCAAANLGRIYVVKNGGGGPSKLVADAADSIDGSASALLNNLNAVSVMSDGATTWHLIGIFP